MGLVSLWAPQVRVQRALPQGCPDVTPLDASKPPLPILPSGVISWGTFPSHSEVCLLQREVLEDRNREMLKSGQSRWGGGAGAGGVP